MIRTIKCRVSWNFYYCIYVQQKPKTLTKSITYHAAHDPYQPQTLCSTAGFAAYIALGLADTSRLAHRHTAFSQAMNEAPDPKRPYYRVDPNMDRYIPNHIPASERWWYFGLSLLILAWGSYGLWVDDLIVPISKRGRSLNLHGTAAVVMFCAMVAAVLNLLAMVIDHFDIRNNELTYRRIAFVTQLAGCVLFVSALVVHVWR